MERTLESSEKEVNDSNPIITTLKTVKEIIESKRIQKLSREALEELTIENICETFDQHNRLSKLTRELKMKDFANDSMKRQYAKLEKHISHLNQAVKSIASEVRNLKTTMNIKSVGIQVNEERASVLSEPTATIIREIEINTNTQSGTSELMPSPPPLTSDPTFVRSASTRSTAESTLPINKYVKKTRVNLISASRSDNILQTDTVQEDSNNLSVQNAERENVVTETISVPPPDQGTSVENVVRSYKRPACSSTVTTRSRAPADLRTPMEIFLGRHVTSSNLPSTSWTTAAMEPALGLTGKPIQIIRGQYVTPESCPEAFIPRPMIHPNRPAQPAADLDTTISTGDCSYQQAVGIIRTRHPAPVPGLPEVQPSQSSWKLIPPKPSLKITLVNHCIVLSWRFPNTDLTLSEEIASYQLYAYRVTNAPPSTDMWRKVGEVKALTLPMACTLAQITTGTNYYFVVRGVDVKSRFGPFSTPEQIHLPTH